MQCAIEYQIALNWWHDDLVSLLHSNSAFRVSSRCAAPRTADSRRARFEKLGNTYIALKEEEERLQRNLPKSSYSNVSSWLVHEYWNRGGVGLHSDTTTPDPPDRKYVLAEDFVAIRFYTYIRYVVTELRNLLFFMALSFSLLFLVLHVYTFRADKGIDWCFVILLPFMGGAVLWILIEMERDPLLSRLEGTQAGEVGKNFYLNLMKYGLVPVATLLGSQIPCVSNFLLTKLQPTLEAFR